NQMIQAGSVPNDPYYSNAWHLPDISAPTAWSSTTGSSHTVIAILDTGIDPAQPDLAPHLVAGYNFVDSNTNTADVQGHGTAVAGAAGAVYNNGIGVTGVCGNCAIMPVRIAFADSNGNPYTYWSTAAAGMQWAVDHGAKIENISYYPVLS